VIGTQDSLMDSCRAFAAALRMADHAKTNLFVAEVMPHGFRFWPGIFPKQEAEAYAAVAAFLDRYLLRGRS
jgi:hypothetical protein